MTIYNLDAEAGIIGILLTNNRSYDDFSDILKPYHFYDAGHERLYSAMVAEIEAGNKVTTVGMIGKVEGATQEILLAYLDAFMTESVARHYAELIIDAYQRRGIMQIAFNAQTMAKAEKAPEVISAIERGLLDLAPSEKGEEVSAFDAAGEAFAWMDQIKSGAIKPIKSGLNSIDKILGGFFGGRLYIVAGRPGMGKTAVSLNMADNIAQSGTPVLFLSLEMARAELAMRLIASRTGVTVDKQQSGEIDMEQSIQMEAARQTLKSLPLIIHDGGKSDILQIRTWCRRFKRTRGKFVLFIDYLGLMGMDKDIKNKVHQIEDITTSLKALAKELDIPVILLSQLSRGLESRDDKRPGLSDLRDSGSIEQDADAVMLCYREEYYLKQKKPQKRAGQDENKFSMDLAHYYDLLNSAAGKAEIIIAKNRQGRDGTARLEFDGPRQLFTDKKEA